MRLLILDRDGVINRDSDAFIKTPEEWHALPGSLEAIARANRAGARVIIASNQSGVGRGLFSIEMLNQIHQKMLRELSAVGGSIDAIFFCPHRPDQDCNCRKPKPGMYEEISRRLRVPMENVPVVVDRLTDIQAARIVGARPCLVMTGKGMKTLAALGQAPDVSVYPDLGGVVDDLIATSWHD